MYSQKKKEKEKGDEGERNDKYFLTFISKELRYKHMFKLDLMVTEWIVV